MEESSVRLKTNAQSLSVAGRKRRPCSFFENIARREIEMKEEEEINQAEGMEELAENVMEEDEIVLEDIAVDAISTTNKKTKA